MKLPTARGPVSEALTGALLRSPHDVPPELTDLLAPVAAAGNPDDVLHDDDLQLTLFICYELHYRGWDGVDEAWEWQPSLLRLRARAEEVFEAALRLLAGTEPAVPPDAVPRALVELAARDDGPSLSGYLRARATLAQFREFVTHRAVYHLREADPHTWAIPRLAGTAKAALVEIQIDEYGGGRVARMHQEMFRRTLAGLGLDTTYGAYVDDVPALTLASNNLMSLFALHRRRRGALLGHLAAYEMTSSLPNRAYGNGLRRLGGDADATAFYDEHVEADAVHEQIAAYDMCGSFCVAEPEAVGDVFFGARCALAVDARWAAGVLDCWQAGRSSLRTELFPVI